MKLEPLCIAGGNVKWRNCFGKVWRFLKKLDTELPCDPAIPLLGLHSKELKIGLKQILISSVHCSIIHGSYKVKKPKCLPIDEWTKQMWYQYLNTVEYTIQL